MSFSFGFFDGEPNKPVEELVKYSTSWLESIRRKVSDIGSDGQELAPVIAVPRPSNFFANSTQHTICLKGLDVQLSGSEKEIKQGDQVTDIVPGKYEGGYRLWECSMDLAEYLIESHSMLGIPNCSHIIELGCGLGVPGIVAKMLFPAGQVLLTDFNDSVLRDVTWPTIISNVANLEGINCLAGDWLQMSKLLKCEGRYPFQLILTAETLYSKEHCEKVAYFIHEHLAEDGLAILANKRFYFGVGGGSTYLSDLFQDLDNGTWEVQTVRSIEDGASNIRDIQLLRRKRH